MHRKCAQFMLRRKSTNDPPVHDVKAREVVARILCVINVLIHDKRCPPCVLGVAPAKHIKASAD